MLFFVGCLFGAACFLMIYGFRILNPLYDDWLFNADMDLKQHYIGFCHYRQSSWQFPIGLIETLSYPHSMSVIYTDSIPLFAVFFKLFSGFLPVRFQYFGIFGLLSFILMGGNSAILLKRFIKNNYICMISSVFFILAYPVIQRLYYHTALASQWIIIAALNLWLYQENMTVRRRILLWSLMGFLCVGIHSYFLPMAGLIMLCALTDQFIVLKRKAAPNKLSFFPDLTGIILQLLSYCAAALFNLFILGGFYGGTSAYGEGLGTFNSNLNTFINPLDDGKFYHSLPLYNGFQYEGFGYIGFGCIFLSVIIILTLIILNIRRVVDLRAILRKHYRIYLACLLFLLTLALAVLPMVTINDIKLFGVPYPEPVRNILGIFRSNGRFIWIATYLLMLLAIAGTERIFRSVKYVPAALISFALLLQIYDISYMLSYKHDYYASEQTYENIWMSKAGIPDTDDYSGFVFLYNENDIIMDTAFYAYLNGMWLNNYYYARDINDLIDKDINEWRHELNNDMARDDVIYIFRSEDYDEKLFSSLETEDSIEGHIYGWKKR
ncbi:MAG: DUF6311 domain-containing protein [Lachnospiraceae bacterium]|nr:DUF6311 domain-containing protein [Lachnospiraceae bacterium]